jgi:hypothetical protein
MSLRCPNCQHKIGVTNAKAGKYKPKCPGCGIQFRLTIPEPGSGEPTAEAMPAEAKSERQILPGTVRMPTPPAKKGRPPREST